MNNMVISVGGGELINIQPGFWVWVTLHPWMTFFIVMAICSAFEAWGKGKKR